LDGGWGISVVEKGIPTLPGMPVRFLTSHHSASTRPAAFAASSVLLPASFSVQASGSVADAEAAVPASQLQVEAFAAAEAAGSVVLPADGSAVALPVDDSAVVPEASVSASPLSVEAVALPVDDSSERVVPDDSAVALPADGSSEQAVPDDSAVALSVDDSSQPAAPDGSAVVLSVDDSSQQAAPDDSAVVLSVAGSSEQAAPDDSAVALSVDDSSERAVPDDSPAGWQAAEWVVPGGQGLADCRDGQWSASPVCQGAPPSPSGAQPWRQGDASFGSHAGPKAARDALPWPAAVLQTTQGAEAASASPPPADWLLLPVARSRDSQSKLSLPARFAGWEPRRPSRLWAPWQSAAGLRQPRRERRAARRQRYVGEPPSPRPAHLCSRRSHW
jgi:hypothetical protein